MLVVVVAAAGFRCTLFNYNQGITFHQEFSSEAIHHCSSETMVNIYPTTQCHVSE
jgi:hypothetical protein